MKTKVEIVNNTIDMRGVIRDMQLVVRQAKEGTISIRQAQVRINAAGKEIEAAKVQLILCAVTKDISKLNDNQLS